MKGNAATHDLLSTWESVKISDVYRFTKKPRDLKPSEQNEVPFIPMDLIPQGGNTKVGFIKKKIGVISSGTYFERGDILLSKITPSFENGKQGIADDIPGMFGYATTEVIPIQAIPGRSSKHFLFYYLLEPEIRRQIADKMEGSTGRQRVPEPVIKEWRIPLPPLEEQRKIASVLWRIQQAIELETNLIRVTRELKAAVMKKLYTEGLNGEPQKETEVGMVPESWEVCDFGDVAKIFNGYAFKSSDIVPSSKIQLLRMGNLYQSQLDLTRNPSFLPDAYLEKHPEFVLEPSDVVMSLTGTMGKEDYGFAVEIPNQLECKLLLNQRVAKLIVKQPDKMSSRFFLHYLRTRMFLDKLYPTAKGTKQANLSSQIMLTLKVPVPPLEEQLSIAAVLDAIDGELINREAKAKSLKELFSSTLSCLMSGTIRVADIDLPTTHLETHGVAA